MVDIRQANENDLVALFKVDSVAGTDEVRKQEIVESVSKKECFLAARGGDVVAYASLNYNFFHRGFVEMLMVDEKFRRQGIGEELLKYLSGICRTQRLWTSTNLSNQPMQKLLMRTGFKQSGHIEGLDEGDPELIFYTDV